MLGQKVAMRLTNGNHTENLMLSYNLQVKMSGGLVGMLEKLAIYGKGGTLAEYARSFSVP